MEIFLFKKSVRVLDSMNIEFNFHIFTLKEFFIIKAITQFNFQN
jgi:hypothetical protein